MRNILFATPICGAPEERFPTIIAINPRIIKISKRTHIVGEGCLSVPKLYGVVKRSTSVTLEALDENGKSFKQIAKGLLAQIIQHECDHLDGTLFIDRAEDAWPVEKEQAKRAQEKS